MATDWNARWEDLSAAAYRCAFGEAGHSAGQAENYNRFLRQAEKILYAEMKAEAAKNAAAFESEEWTRLVDPEFAEEMDIPLQSVDGKPMTRTELAESLEGSGLVLLPDAETAALFRIFEVAALRESR
jgi:hypothetical protein